MLAEPADLPHLPRIDPESEWWRLWLEAAGAQLVEMPRQQGPVLEETFAPILYVMRYAERVRKDPSASLVADLKTSEITRAPVGSGQSPPVAIAGMPASPLGVGPASRDDASARDGVATMDMDQKPIDLSLERADHRSCE